MNERPKMLCGSERISSSPLSCAGLALHQGQRCVLSGVDLEVPTGVVLGLVGRNGAGKTTLIRGLLGLLPASAGEARLFGRPAVDLDDDGRQRLGYVPQQTDAFGWLSVRDLLTVIGQCYPRWDAGWVDTMLDRWALDPRAQVGKLSPGERQRLALIRAMAHGPELLVLDEPAAALDPAARRDVLRELIQRTGRQGTTVLFSTHIVSDLERVASDVAVLHGGELAFHLPIEQLREELIRLHVPVELVVGASSRLPGELARHPQAGGGLRLLLRRVGDDWPALAQAPGVLRDHPGLEDVLVEMAA